MKCNTNVANFIKFTILCRCFMWGSICCQICCWSSCCFQHKTILSKTSSEFEVKLTLSASMFVLFGTTCSLDFDAQLIRFTFCLEYQRCVYLCLEDITCQKFVCLQERNYFSCSDLDTCMISIANLYENMNFKNLINFFV